MALSPEERTQAINNVRERYNTVLKTTGFQAPAPIAGERVGDYRRRAVQTIADSMLPQHHQFAKINYDDIPFEVFKNFEPQVLSDAVTEYKNPDNVPNGEMRRIHVFNEYTGALDHVDWIGRHSFVHDLKSPVRRVVSFWTGTGPPFAASGRFLK
jgi:hypothetical protein